MFEHVLKALPEHIRFQNIKGTTQKKNIQNIYAIFNKRVRFVRAYFQGRSISSKE